MTSYSYASLTVPVYADTRHLTVQIQREATAAGEKAGKSAGKSWGSNFLGTIGKAIAVVGAERIFESMISGAEESERVNKATEAAIRATGSAAHVTAAQVSGLADALMQKTSVDDETIKSGSNMLLTFRNVRNETGRGNDIFNQATSTLLDMTAAMTGGNVTQEAMRKQAIQLGKSLNDPIAGMGALRRVGVTFTEQQKQQITTLEKSGNTLGAQKVILAELSKEFGGAAASYATPMTRLKTATGELTESLGTALLPALGAVSNWLIAVGIPALTSFGGWLARNKAWVVPLAGTIAAFTATLYLASKAVLVLNAAMRLLGLAELFAMGPITLVIAGLVALGVGLYLLWTRCRTFRVIVEAAFHAVAVAFDFLASHWRQVVLALLIITTGGFAALALIVISNWTRIRNFITGTTAAIWRVVTSVFTNIRNFISGVQGAVQRNVAAWWNNVVVTISGALSRAWSNLAGWFGRLPGQIASWGAAAVRAWASLGGSMISGLLGGISGAMRNIAGWVNRVVVQPIVGAVKRFFGIHSPSTVMEAVGSNLTAGLFRGLAADAGGLVKMVFGGWPQALGGLIGKGFAAITALPGKALAALGSVAGKIGGFFKGLFGGGGGGTSPYAGMMRAVLSTFGIPQLFGVFMQQMQTESGGNPRAINLWDSNAKAGTPSMGIMQVIQPTFDAFAGPFRSRGIWDPLANIYAAVAYAVARYGSRIAAVLGHGHGYAGGGVVAEPVVGIGVRSGEPYSFAERGAELVSPLTGPMPRLGGGATVINIYPREGQSETAIAASVNANLHWAAAGGQA